MKRSLGLLNALVLACLTALAVTSPSVAFDDTVDILHMIDGRVLRGEIISETDTQIVFETVDEKVNIRMKVSVAKSEIAKIERDVSTGENEDDGESDSETTRSNTRSNRGATSRPSYDTAPTDSRRRIGAGRGDADDEALTGFYVVPMRGQMGTDVCLELYEEVIEDIKRVQPEVLIYMLDCSAVDELMPLSQAIGMPGQEEDELMDLDQYRKIVNLLQRETPRSTRQVVWVHDSYGISSPMALAWPEMYMTPDAKLGGIGGVWANAASWDDPDVRAKMIAAWVGTVNGFLELGGNPRALGEAMMDPTKKLSATWKGREVDWSLDEEGEYIVDHTDEATVAFSAKSAEDFCISHGTAETIDDLALLLGYREYRILNGDAEHIVDDHIERWRDVYEQTLRWGQEAQDAMNGRGPRDQQAALGKAKGLYQKILNAMKRYKPVELRWQMDYGISILQMQVTIDQIKELLRQGGGGGGGGGGRGGGNGIGPGDGG